LVGVDAWGLSQEERIASAMPRQLCWAPQGVSVEGGCHAVGRWVDRAGTRARCPASRPAASRCAGPEWAVAVREARAFRDGPFPGEREA